MSSKNNVDILITNASELLTCKPFDPKKPKTGEDLKDNHLEKYKTGV